MKGVMDSLQEFNKLMEQVRGGSDEAARALFERYGGHVRRVVRRRLDQRLRGQYDSDDFTQAVWASFFATPVTTIDFTNPDDLVSFLASMAYNKVAEAYRRRIGAAKRDCRRERPLQQDHDEKSIAPRDPRQATPSQEAIANEHWEQLIADQPAHYRLALELLRRGHTHAETAARLGMNPKSIQRLLEKLNRGSPRHE